ncbi:MAG TPA: hypothetical protein VFA70_15815 [Dehalococcoidia bacterium]|nr:hypothetical protein [Dehalococcoidia bacterium]
MPGYLGWAELLDEYGRVLDHAQVELWSGPAGTDDGWSGDLLPIGKRRFAAALNLRPGARLNLRLPNGRAAICEVERRRQGEPELVRIGGRGPAPFG